MNDFDYSDLRARRRNSWLNTLNQLLKFLVWIVFIGVLICTFVPQVKKKRATEARVEQLKSEVALKKEELARRKREENLLKNDPEYIALMARDKLDVMKPGETVIRVESGNRTPKPAEKNPR